jgi:hypothetical protein
MENFVPLSNFEMDSISKLSIDALPYLAARQEKKTLFCRCIIAETGKRLANFRQGN